MTDIIKLIEEKKIEEVKELSNFEYKIQELLKDALNGNLTKEYEKIDFEADKYQKEFIEGVKIFKALLKADYYMESMLFSTVLVFLGYKTGEFIQLLSNTALNKGVNLSEISSFNIESNLRNSMQEFYDLMDDNYLAPKANIAAAKTRISQAVFNQISKTDFGNDMLQMGISYEKISEKEMATRIYKGVMNDFESESVKSSSGLFPEISQVDNRKQEEIEIYSKAKELLENLTETKIEESKRIHINQNSKAKELVENLTETKVEEPKRVHINQNSKAKGFVDEFDEQITKTTSNKQGFLSKLKKWFS